jgi:hypothetical protein
VEKYKIDDQLNKTIIESIMQDLRVGILYDMEKFEQNIQ